MRNSDIVDMVDEMLNDEGPVQIGNLTFDRSEIVRRCDPTAYRIMVNEYIDSMIDDLRYDQERLDPTDMAEHQEIQERIDELEGEIGRAHV